MRTRVSMRRQRDRYVSYVSLSRARVEFRPRDRRAHMQDPIFPDPIKSVEELPPRGGSFCGSAFD